MPDREPPIFTSSESIAAGRLPVASTTQRSWLPLASLTLLAICMTFAGLIFGFIVGDSFGRRNAQYDNPDLREYYAGKCYDYWDSQLKQTLHSSLQQDALERRGQAQKLDEIFAKMQDLEHALVEFTAPPHSQVQSTETARGAVAAAKTPPRKL